MAEQEWPNQNANKSKAEGERFGEQAQDEMKNADRENHPEHESEDRDRENAGGITNRPLSEEVGNQEELPERGTTKDQTRNPASRRQEGDYQEGE